MVRMAEDAVSVAHVVKRLFESEKELKAKAKQAAAPPLRKPWSSTNAHVKGWFAARRCPRKIEALA